jgi:predicted RNase H-like nuclease (RuvC/YqgF family)
VIFLRDASGAGRSTAERLAEIQPRVVLKDGGNLSDIADEILFENEIPVGSVENVGMQEVDELAVAREGDVEDVINDWHDRAEERRREQNAEMVDQIISEHRVRDDEAGASGP